MTDSMVERVGAALSSLPDSSWDDYEWGDLPSGVREGFIEQARAAITAMREPTDAMIDRFVSRALSVSIHSDGGWSSYAREQWQAMIDGALGEGQTNEG